MGTLFVGDKINFIGIVNNPIGEYKNGLYPSQRKFNIRAFKIKIKNHQVIQESF